MIFDKNSLRVWDTFKIRINDDFVLRLEDAYKAKKEVVLTVDASHFGMRNANGTIYRHDTVADDIHSFIYPSPKPIIERHKPKESIHFGKVVGADVRNTKFYDEFSENLTLENLSTAKYINLCKDELLPYQKKNPWYNGLSYLQLTAKVTHEKGIQKILDGEFHNVSIGADPIRLVCSECGQDQVSKICHHFAQKGNNIFMLAESLQYEELSFVPRGADPFGRITKIHDEEIQEAEVGLLSVQDFYKIAEGKTIVCVENICKICDQEDEMGLRKSQKPIVSLGFADEFSQERIEKIELQDEDKISLEDSEKTELKDNQFAIIQTNGEDIKRRFPLNSKGNVVAAIALFDEATDLTEHEREKALIQIRKAAKKFGIELTDAAQTTDEGNKDEPKIEDEPKQEADAISELAQKIQDALSQFDTEEKLQDYISESSDKPKPMAFLFSALANAGRSLKWAGEDLANSIDGFLQSLGKLAVEKGTYDSLNDELKELKDELTFKDEEISLLDRQNVELNHLVRVSLVDSIIDSKKALGKLTDEASEHTKLMGYTYEGLKELSGELKSLVGDKPSFNNNKQFNKIQDPTLLDEDHTDDNRNEDEVKFSDKDFIQGFKSLFRK